MTDEGLLETAGRARWARLASLGFLIAGLGPLLVLLAGIAWGLDIGDDAPFFIATSVAVIGAGVLVRRDVMWMRIVALVLGLLVGLMLFWTAFGLTEIDSFFDFVPGTMVLPGILVGIGSGIAAIRSQRSGTRVMSAEGGEKTAMIVVPVVIGGLALVSGGLTLGGQDSVDESQSDLTVRMTDFEFEPDPVSASAGDVVLVKNDDPFLHTFTIDDLNVDLDLSPGSEALVTLPSQPGTYTLYCVPHTDDPDAITDDDMATELTVTP